MSIGWTITRLLPLPLAASVCVAPRSTIAVTSGSDCVRSRGLVQYLHCSGWGRGGCPTRGQLRRVVRFIVFGARGGPTGTSSRAGHYAVFARFALAFSLFRCTESTRRSFQRRDSVQSQGLMQRYNVSAWVFRGGPRVLAPFTLFWATNSERGSLAWTDGRVPASQVSPLRNQCAQWRKFNILGAHE